MEETRINVWCDETSEPGQSRWIVSRDSYDDDGEPTGTTTLGVYATEADARAAAARERRVPPKAGR